MHSKKEENLLDFQSSIDKSSEGSPSAQKENVQESSKKEDQSVEAGLDFVKSNLLSTLDYIDSQLNDVDDKTKNFSRFSRNIYEVKKMLVEQKLSVLKQMSHLSIEMHKQNIESSNVSDITDILKK
jgi:hypothetical protein